MKKIIIIGGGAGGLELATQLGNRLGKKEEAKITLVDKNVSHLWKPLLHEIATGALDDNLNSVDYAEQGKNHYFNFCQGSLLDINREYKQVIISPNVEQQNGDASSTVVLDYDILVVAIGSQANDFGTPGVHENCLFLNSHIEAQQFRQLMTAHFYHYAMDETSKDKKTIDVAIVGAGATGVELASELYPMLDKFEGSDESQLDSSILNITLIEAANRILPALPEALSYSIQNALENKGIKVLTNTMITEASKTGFYTKDCSKIEADIMVWTAGVKAPEFLKDIAGLESNRTSQLVVKPTLQTTRDDSIFAIGDCCACEKPEGGFVPATAQAANQMAALCVKNITAYINGKPLKEFVYKDKGTIISLANTAQGVVTTVGNAKMTVKGYVAHSIYKMLYRMHQASLFGVVKTLQLAHSDKTPTTIKKEENISEKVDKA